MDTHDHLLSKEVRQTMAARAVYSMTASAPMNPASAWPSPAPDGSINRTDSIEMERACMGAPEHKLQG